MTNVVNVNFGKQRKLVHGAGVNDVKGAKVNHKAAYTKWQNMLMRCYNTKYQERFPTYIGCSVCPEWLKFSGFLVFWNQLSDTQKDYCLDKDILYPGNKVYSPETCVMIPQWLNKFMNENNRQRGDLPTGVTLDKRVCKYHAQISINGKRKFLGLFTTPEAAHEAWLKAKIDLIHGMRDELNAIDTRLYPALLTRYGVDNALPLAA